MPESIVLPTRHRFKNLTGRQFGRLTAVEYVGMNRKRGAIWRCRCICGTIKEVVAVDLSTGNTKSCGCISQENLADRNHRHGMSGTPEYLCWQHMLRRCRDPKTNHFHRYGGRGITVCERWMSFENFFADMGRKPSPGHQIDRIDNDGNYEPTNCRWVTRKEQARNRYTNTFLEWGGLRLTLAEWGERTGINATILSDRLTYGWTVSEILTRPPRQVQRSATCA